MCDDKPCRGRGGDPDGTYYNHSVLDKAIKERYGDRLAEMMAEKAYMEHFTKVRE